MISRIISYLSLSFAVSEADIIKDKVKPVPVKKGMAVNEITMCYVCLLAV